MSEHIHETTVPSNPTRVEAQVAVSESDDENLSQSIGRLVQQFDEVIQLLDPTKRQGVPVEANPMVLFIPGEADGDETTPGTAVVLPGLLHGGRGEIDQEKLGRLLETTRSTLEKIDFGKIVKTIAPIAKGALGGIAGGPAGMIMGAAGAGLDLLTGQKPTRPSAPPGRGTGSIPQSTHPPVPGLPAAGGAPLLIQYITTNCGHGTTVATRSTGTNARTETVVAGQEGQASESMYECGECGARERSESAGHAENTPMYFHNEVHESIPVSHSVAGESHAGESSATDGVLAFVTGARGQVAAPAAGSRAIMTESDILAFVTQVKSARQHLLEALPVYQGLEWQSE